MLPRKGDRLEKAVSNWMEDIESLRSRLQKKTNLIIEYANRILDMNNSNLDEKIFLMDGLEDTIFVLKNDTFNKLDILLEDILGNEIKANKDVSIMMKKLRETEKSIDDIHISLKNFFKTYNLTKNNTSLLSNFIADTKNKLSAYKENLNKLNQLFSKIWNFLVEQQKVSRGFDII